MARVAEDTRRPPSDGVRKPPQNLEAEESVLGSMMLSTEAIAEVIEEIKADNFYRSSHRVVFEALVHLYSRGEPVDGNADPTRTEFQNSRGDVVEHRAARRAARRRHRLLPGRHREMHAAGRLHAFAR